jgi:hypothetical protein
MTTFCNVTKDNKWKKTNVKESAILHTIKTSHDKSKSLGGLKSSGLLVYKNGKMTTGTQLMVMMNNMSIERAMNRP